MKFSSDFAAELQAALTEMCKSEELVLAVYPNKFPILNSPGCNFQWNVKSSLPPVAFGLITLFCPSSLGELTCSRSNSAAKYRKEDFLHYKKTFLCCKDFSGELENPLPLICWVTLKKSLSLCLLPSLIFSCTQVSKSLGQGPAFTVSFTTWPPSVPGLCRNLADQLVD